MSIIKVENLTFTYLSSYDNIFENTNFQIDTDWKLGFIGRNGRGKTTFLNLLLGKYEYMGKITSSVKFDYFPYEIKDKTKLVYEIFEEISENAEQWELIRELSYLDIDASILYRSYDTLSNGEQTKVMLSALFCNKGHFLLIDEPTNHLDTRGRELVANYLRKKKGFILVSHDRKFLDGCVDHILSINRATIEVQSGNFSSWFENFTRTQQFEMTQNERFSRDIGRLQSAADRTAVWSDRIEATKIGGGGCDRGFIGHKSAKMMKRAKAIKGRVQSAIDQKKNLLKDVEKAEELKLAPQRYRMNTLVSLSEVVVFYDGKDICSPITFDINQGDRIVLKGKNGSGKSSLIKIIIGDDIFYNGVVKVNSGLTISYVPQEFSHIKGNLSTFAKEHKIDESLFKTILRKMDFDRNQFDKDISDFSCGQKKKVLLAKSLCEEAHLYIWDEPLNYIDLYSRMQIEKLLKEFAPTMIFVEHDKAFCEEIATKTIEL